MNATTNPGIAIVTMLVKQNARREVFSLGFGQSIAGDDPFTLIQEPAINMQRSLVW